MSAMVVSEMETTNGESVADAAAVRADGNTTFIGVDLHKCSVTMAAVDGRGEKIDVVTLSTKCVQRIDRWLAELPGPRWMGVESVGFAEWFIDRYRYGVERIDIVHARELSNQRGKRRKNDRNDALDVARRLARGEAPLGYIADEDVMHMRKLGRHWRRLSRNLSRTKHGMKSILNATNIRGPKFDGASVQKWFLAHGHLLKEVDHDAFSDLLDQVLLLERQRATLRRRIMEANRSEAFKDQVEQLKTVPGIDEIWACIIAAEVGPFTRFPNADTLEFWAGITADNEQSAGQSRCGNITKAGSATLRWALCKAAQGLCRSDARQAGVRERLRRKLGRPKANVAMGRRLLGILYAMARDGAIYERGPSTGHTRAANEARRRKNSKKKEARA